MTTPWSEVAASPEFQALAPEDKEGARQQYFNEVVAPNVKPEHLAGVRQQFDYDTAKTSGGKFTSTPGGAAVGNPQMERTSMPRSGNARFGEAAAEIGGAGVIGGVMGAALPEILGVAGGAAAAFPQTARLAPLLSSMRTAAITAGRPASATAGAVSGLSGETAGQVSEAMGAPQIVSEGARFAGGAVGPEMVNLAKWGFDVAVKAPALSIWHKITKEGLKTIVQRFEADPKSITQAEREYLDQLIADVRGAAKSDQPMKAVYGGLESGATRARSVAQSEAANILANAEREANQEISTAMRGDVAKRRAALPRLQEIGDSALEAARAQRTALGADREVSDIGNEVRGLIVARNQAGIDARIAEDNVLRKARDAIVSQKESARQFVNDLPEYRSLLGSLQSEKGNRSPDVRSSFEHILKSVTNPEKDVFGQAKPISFQQLDDVRRELGQVFKGTPAEGYAAIDANTARRYYGRIAEIQKKFAGGDGGAQDRLQKAYADATDGLQMFGSKSGKRATAMDRYDDERFATDAGMLPRQFFKSKQGVQDLLDLTGDSAKVVKAGKEFAANELRDASESQVRAWMTKNRDWLTTSNEGRQVWEAVGKYADNLQRGERIAKNVEKGSKFVQTSIGDRITEAERTATGIRRAGERNAATAITGGEATANALVGNKFPVERVRQLIESGDRAQWEAASSVIHSSPTAKAALPGAVRQVIADRAFRSPKGIVDFFERNVRPAVETTGLMSSAEANNLRSQLLSIENMKLSEPEKLGIARRLLLQSVGGYAAGVIPRGLSELIPQ